MLKYSDAYLNDRFTLTAGFGGNSMRYSRRSTKVTLSEIDIDNVFNLDNYPSGVIPDNSMYRSEKVVNSLYGLLSLGWDDWAYLDVTARNDWSSTLAKGYWSYFYPSVSASLLIDKVANFQQNAPWCTYLKVRASWANVGKDTSAYALDQTYTATNFAGGYRPNATTPKIDLAPENVETWEAGIEAKFLKNRIGFDVAVYQSDATNQIYDVPYDYITGSKYYTQNVGLIRNRGIEISAHFAPVKTKDWTWTIDVNATRNVGKLLRMYDGWDNNTPYESNISTSIGGRFHIYNFVGQQMGAIYGYAPDKAPEGSDYLDADGNKVDCSGQVIITSKTGLPTAPAANATDSKSYNGYYYLGNVNPDWTGGLSTMLRWKDLTLSATFSAQLGGKTYSVTAANLSYQGKLTNSLEGRYDGMVIDGVNAIESTDAEGNKIVTYQKNTTLCTDVQSYYNSTYGSRYNFERYTYDTSFIKLKELRLEYKFPQSLLNRQKVKVLQGASIAFFATNLFCVSNFPFYDPEVGSFSGSNIVRGVEAGSFPMNRSYGFNLKVQF